MPGKTFNAGEKKVRPGVYVRAVNKGGAAPGVVPQGIVGAIFRSSWGPVNTPTVIESQQAVTDTFGSTGTTDTLVEALTGGCQEIVAYRAGSGGVVATVNLQDDAAADAVQVDAKYQGVRGNNLTLTVRDSLSDSSLRELLVYEGTTLRQTITFAKTGATEPTDLVDAVNAVGSDWIDVTLIASGSGTLAAASDVALTGGTDPAIAGSDYSNALDGIENEEWNVLAVDSEDPTIHATVQTYIDRVRGDGKRVMAVVGEPTSVTLATRMTDAKAFNDEAIVYVANGFVGSDGSNREGYKAAARVAGRIASAAVTDSLTHAVITSATDLVGGLSNSDVQTAIQSGAMVFTKNASRQVQVEYGINTLITPSADQDAGWKKIRRVRTRDDLIERIVASTDPLVGRVNNDPDGQATIIAAMNGVINRMIAEGALLDGKAALDPDRASQGDSAYFTINVDDLDSVEKLYLTFGFSFSPAA